MPFNDAVFEETKKIIVTLKKEGDRGCVLVAGALLENALEKSITARLIKSEDKDDRLMSRSGNAPISTFSAKIELYYRLGLCADSERQLCHQLRNLRNDCAHRTDEQDFSNISFKHRIENIISQSQEAWEAIKDKFEPVLGNGKPAKTIHEFVENIGWRPAFTLFFAFLIALIHQNAENIPRIKTTFKKA